MDNSPLARLPPELRVVVYEYSLLEEGDGVILDAEPRDGVDRCTLLRIYPNCRSPYDGLPSTCRQIRRESRAVYFAVNTFRLDVAHHLGISNLDTLGADMVQHIGHVYLRHPGLRLRVRATGQIAVVDGYEDHFFQALRAITKSLSGRARTTFEMRIKLDPEDGCCFLDSSATVRNAEDYRHSLCESLRFARECMEIDETNEEFVTSVATLAHKMRA